MQRSHTQNILLSALGGGAGRDEVGEPRVRNSGVTDLTLPALPRQPLPLPRKHSAMPRSASGIGKLCAMSTSTLPILGRGEKAKQARLAASTTTPLPYSQCNLAGIGTCQRVRVCDFKELAVPDLDQIKQGEQAARRPAWQLAKRRGGNPAGRPAPTPRQLRRPACACRRGVDPQSHRKPAEEGDACAKQDFGGSKYVHAQARKRGPRDHRCGLAVPDSRFRAGLSGEILWASYRVLWSGLAHFSPPDPLMPARLPRCARNDIPCHCEERSGEAISQPEVPT